MTAVPDKSTFRYTVACRFASGDREVANRWLEWLIPGHLDDVIRAGAVSAEVVQIDDTVPHYEIRYVFASRADFGEYEQRHAPRLRAEGLAKFPAELGLEFRRTTGEVLTCGDR